MCRYFIQNIVYFSIEDSQRRIFLRKLLLEMPERFIDKSEVIAPKVRLPHHTWLKNIYKKHGKVLLLCHTQRFVIGDS